MTAQLFMLLLMLLSRNAVLRVTAGFATRASAGRNVHIQMMLWLTAGIHTPARAAKTSSMSSHRPRYARKARSSLCPLSGTLQCQQGQGHNGKQQYM
jgi:hypothetical protein